MTAAAPLDREGMRRHNLGLVLRTIADGDRPSRSDVATRTRLHKTTVSSLVAELIARELVREAGSAGDGSVGRPAVALELAGERYVALGLEVNVDHLTYTAIDLTGRIREHATVWRDNRGVPATQTLRALAELVAGPRRALVEGGAIEVGASLALPGLVDASAGVLLVAPNLGWREVPVADLLQAALGDALPIRTDNEANLAALGERWYGAGRTHRDFVYVSGSVGVGAGIVSNGALHRGETGFGGEFGHLTLQADGPVCACGARGCVEALAGLEALLRAASRPGHTPTSAAEVVTAATAGDEVARIAIEQVGTWLGIALASTANLMGSRAVVLGGYFAALEPWLRAPIEEQLATRVLAATWSPIEVLGSELLAGAAVTGAAGVALRAILDDPVSAPAIPRT
ncbi:MAG: ROK family transcriptional regulator [Nitriliruptoraceae bacterium]|nr:ROK family transcriptional regulator [Nitriliruptoraceae bacterium]